VRPVGHGSTGRTMLVPPTADAMAEPVPDESGVSLRFPRNAERGVEETLHPAFVRLCVYTSKYSATSYG
jgi:hypothetical protein